MLYFLNIMTTAKTYVLQGYKGSKGYEGYRVIGVIDENSTVLQVLWGL